MRYLIVLICLVWGFTLPVFAQTYEVTGVTASGVVRVSSSIGGYCLRLRYPEGTKTDCFPTREECESTLKAWRSSAGRNRRWIVVMTCKHQHDCPGPIKGQKCYSD
jgi:hypothetical protein